MLCAIIIVTIILLLILMMVPKSNMHSKRNYNLLPRYFPPLDVDDYREALKLYGDSS